LNIEYTYCVTCLLYRPAAPEACLGAAGRTEESAALKYFLATLLAAASAFAPARAATGAAALDPLAGTWESTTTSNATPYSKAGSTTATTACAWSTSHDYLICQQSYSDGTHDAHDVAVYTYDASGEKYHFYAIRANGVSDVGITVDASSIMYTSTFTDGGKGVTVRTLNVWDDPDHYHFWTEYSSDGLHWTRMLTGNAHRTAPPAASP